MAFNPTQEDWKQIAYTAKQQWSKLTEADLGHLQGNEELLIGRLKELYGMSSEEAREQVTRIRQNLQDAVHGGEMYGGAKDGTA